METQPKQDMHRADIIAMLRKKGKSLVQLSIGAGLGARTLNNALERKYPKGEKIIAEALGLNPADIWPSRYPKENLNE